MYPVQLYEKLAVEEQAHATGKDDSILAPEPSTRATVGREGLHDGPIPACSCAASSSSAAL